MKKRHVIFGSLYGGILFMIVGLSTSCEDDPIAPNEPVGNGVDTTWVDPNDTLGGNGTPNDTLGGNGSPNDSLGS